MTAPRRLVPVSQVREMFDFLREQGIDVAKCGVDIGPDYVKVSPPANSNVGDSIDDYINRSAPGKKEAKGR